MHVPTTPTLVLDVSVASTVNDSCTPLTRSVEAAKLAVSRWTAATAATPSHTSATGNAARALKQSLRNVNSAYDVFSASISRLALFLRSATTLPWNAGPIKFRAMA